MKVNFDGTVFQDTYHARLSVVIRDFEGKVLSVLSERTKLPPTVDDVEAMTYKRAIEFAIENGLQQSLFGGDSAVGNSHKPHQRWPTLSGFVWAYC